MLDIKTLNDIRGNNVVIYTLKTLLSKNTFPKFAIFHGNMGVGKSSVAALIAREITGKEFPVTTFNFGLTVDMKELESAVFSLNPISPRAFVFEELHGLDKAQQTALLTMLDKQPSNVCIICTTTELYRVLKTMQSRATKFEFKLLGEKQLSQLLDDYLDSKGQKFSRQAKQTLLQSARGVPRDLLKNADLAIAGGFSGEQLDALLGRLSQDLIFTLLCSLKSTAVDFAGNITKLMEESEKDKLYQLRDFFTRFLLERKGIPGGTLGAEKISTINSLFSDEELERIGKMLVRAKPETLILELSLLNMELTKTTPKQMVGQQIDRAAQAQTATRKVPEQAAGKTKLDAAKLTGSALRQMKLGETK